MSEIQSCQVLRLLHFCMAFKHMFKQTWRTFSKTGHMLNSVEWGLACTTPCRLMLEVTERKYQHKTNCQKARNRNHNLTGLTRSPRRTDFTIAMTGAIEFARDILPLLQIKAAKKKSFL